MNPAPVPGTPDPEPPKPQPLPLFFPDISHWQPGVTADIVQSWKSAGATRIMIKAGGGNNGRYESDKHREQVAAAHACGLPADRYWFNGQDASVSDQVNFLVDMLKATPLQAGELVMWDAEPEESNGVVYTRAWTPAEVVTAAQRAVARGVPFSQQLIYLNSAQTTGSVDWSPVVDLGIRLVVADYWANDGTPGGMPLVGFWPREQIHAWQFTSQGKLGTYSGDLDLNTGDLRRVWTVADLQAALNIANGAALVVDNRKGAKTNAEIIVFQKSQNLKPDGIAGPATLTKLAEVAG
ncbi:peptidoglycan-binding protein [Microbacterium sp. MMO-10]|uniref:peptidoglycan-binding protein n=1 Tax=Microbacterium sp. MMO-10 TaxID=3081272 RepID=UPI003018D41F